MRLHEELIKQGILHLEQEVRSEAVLYFSGSNTSDESILPLAIQAIEKHSWDDAFRAVSYLKGLPLDDVTLPWVLAQLQHQDVKKPDPYGWTTRWDTLNSLLSNADAALLARHKQAISDVQCLESRVVEKINKRIDLLTAGGEVCWRELEKFCVDSKDVDDLGRVDLDHAYALCEAIAREEDEYAEKVLAILGEKIEVFESNPKVWMEIFAIRMAGEMRLEAATPLIIAKLKEADENDDWLMEECETALAKIGSDATITAVADIFRQSKWHLRISASGLLKRVHSDLAVATALELLPDEKDQAVRAFLADGLISQFAFEAIEPLRQFVRRGDYDETDADLKSGLLVATTLMGVELPEREQWKADVERERQERAKRLLQRMKAGEARDRRQARQWIEPDEYIEEEPPRTRTGRNDPCPCGSGKKFKKCCLKKQRSSDQMIWGNDD